MSARVSVRMVGGSGRDPDRSGLDVTPIAVKTATTPQQTERLAAEADLLRRVRHPGVVTYVDHHSHAGRSELHLLYVGDSLERWHGSVEQAAGIGAAVATTLAELHDAGLSHGRLDRSHVLLGADNRPVLCGLSPVPGNIDPAADVAALGHLLGGLLSEAASGPAAPRWRRMLEPAGPRRRLEQAIARATDPDPGRRPPARAFAHAILDALPRATLPADSPVPPPPSPSRLAEQASLDLFDRAFVDQNNTGDHEIFDDRPWVGHPNAAPAPSGSGRYVRAAALASISLPLLVGAVWALRGPGGDSAPGSRRTATECPTTAAGTGRSDTTTHLVDINGDGCPDNVWVTPDGVVETSAGRWAVGEPGDQIALGDWNCDGRSTPAVYRAGTGSLFVFSTWADDNQPLTAAPVAAVPGGVALAAGPAEDTDGVPSCDVPLIELASGDSRAVELAP